MLYVRFLPNPYWDAELKPFTGQAPRVAEYVLENVITSYSIHYTKLYDELARQGLTSPQMQAVALAENLPSDYIRQMVAEGKIVIPWNSQRRPSRIAGIGKGLATKVNASIGTSVITSYSIHYTKLYESVMEVWII